MKCAWQELIMILPQWLRATVDAFREAQLQEIRMRVNSPPELILPTGSKWLTNNVNESDLNYVINTASRYSPWSAATISQGFISAPGGHRIGICGESVIKDGMFSGIRTVRSLCIRIARDITGLLDKYSNTWKSTLIIGAPGWGKTTLLRDLIRILSSENSVCVVDERQELFPSGFAIGKKTDILCGCPKQQGIEIVLKTMGPQIIAVDEITSAGDCEALLQAYGCGVRLLATAHAADMHDLQCRCVYAPLMQMRIFDTFLILHPDKTFHMEVLK